MERTEATTDGHEAGGPVLEVRDLAVSFESYGGRVRALEGVNLTLPRGTITGLVGESGSGKSVTSRAVMGLLRPPAKVERGQVRFEGNELLTMSKRAIRDLRGDRMSMVFQNPRASLNPLFPVGEQMYYILKQHRRATRKQADDRSTELLERVGITDPRRRLSSYPFEMSSGMCQRVMIAMALLCDPELLIADEPTTGLDVTIQAQVLELFAKLVRDFRSTALLITHDLGVVAETCDRVAVMYAGTIVEHGSTADVFGAPRHPYTQGLLAASVIDEGPINYIRGGVPDLVHRPRGCAFAERCYAAEGVCHDRMPTIEPWDAEHGVACHAAQAVREGDAWPSYRPPNARSSGEPSS